MTLNRLFRFALYANENDSGWQLREICKQAEKHLKGNDLEDFANGVSAIYWDKKHKSNQQAA